MQRSCKTKPPFEMGVANLECREYMGDKMRKTAITLVLTIAIFAAGCGNQAGSSAINKAAEVAEAASLDESSAAKSQPQDPEEEMPEGLKEAFAKRNNDDNEDDADEKGAGGGMSKSGHGGDYESEACENADDNGYSEEYETGLSHGELPARYVRHRGYIPC